MKQTHAFSRPRALLLFLFLPIIICLSGCETQTYEETEAWNVISTGKAILENWISENMPGAEIVSSNADEFAYPGGGKHYLNGYVSGQIKAEKTIDYTVSTKTGQVYLEADLNAFADIAYDYILESLEFPEIEEVDDYAVRLELPYCYEGSSKSYSLKEKLQTYHVLPAEIALLLPEGTNAAALSGDVLEEIRSYIQDPANRDLFSVVLWGSVSDEISLKQYGLKKIHGLKEENGIYLHNFSFYNNDESINGSAWLSDYSRNEWIEKEDGLILRAEVEGFGDTEDKKSPDGIKREAYAYSADDIVVETTETGFRMYPAKDKGPSYYLFAKDGSPFLEHVYIVKEEVFETPVSWKYFDYTDLWRLNTDDGHGYFFHQPVELIIRED